MISGERHETKALFKHLLSAQHYNDPNATFFGMTPGLRNISLVSLVRIEFKSKGSFPVQLRR